MDKETKIMIYAVSSLVAVFIFVCCMAVYCSENNPCKCIKEECFATSGTNIDTSGRVSFSSGVSCACLQEKCDYGKFNK